MKIRMYNIAYFFRLAFQGIVRNGLMSFVSVIVLTSSLIITGSSYLIKKNAEYNLKELNDYNKIILFMNQETDTYTTKAIIEKIQSFDSVVEVELRTKDVILKNILEEYGDYSDILQMYGEDNPCKDELIITYSDPSKVSTIVYKIETMNEQEETLHAIEKINDRKEVAEKIEKITNIVSLVLTWIMVLLSFIAVFIIINTVKLAVYSRREEVSIMRYVGATSFFVSCPFVLEGIILGIFSSGIALGIQYYIYKAFAIDVLGSSGLITILPFGSMIKILILGFILIGVGLGVVGSLISLRKYNNA